MASALTPAEALVLWKGVDTAPEAVRATLTALVVQGVIRLEKTRGLLGFGKTSTRLHVAGELPPDAPAFLAEIVASARAAEARGGSLDALVRALRKRYGRGFRKLTRQDVAAALELRGLASYRRLRVLGVPLWRRLRLTPEGVAEKKRIEAELARARRLPAKAKKERIAGMTVGTGIGVLFVLLPELRPFTGEIGAALRQQAGETASSVAETGKAVFEVDFSVLDAAVDSASGRAPATESAGDDGDGTGAGVSA